MQRKENSIIYIISHHKLYICSAIIICFVDNINIFGFVKKIHTTGLFLIFDMTSDQKDNTACMSAM